MPQQVVHARVKFKSTHANMDDPSMDFVLEATGSDVNLDFGTDTKPQNWIKGFFNDVGPGQTNALCYYIANNISRTNGDSVIEWYDVTAHLNGSSAGSPFRMDTWQLGAGGNFTDYAPGVCVLGAYRAAYASDMEHVGATRPRARDRGRLYFGPLNTLAIETIAGLVTPAFSTDFAAAIDSHMQTQNSTSANQFNWVVWSRKAAAVKPAEFYYVDEAATYQRRRADSTESRTHAWIPR
jgi:hypothetical protein